MIGEIQKSFNRVGNISIMNNMKELDEFKTFLTGEKYLKAVKYLNDKYFSGDTTYALGVYEGEEHHHAKTHGTGTERAIIFNTLYLKRILTCEKANEEAVFAKIVSTFRHERVHIAQRADADYKKKSTKEEREFMAYSEELIPADNIPALTGELWEKTYEKACEVFNGIPTPVATEYKNRKDYIDSLHQ